MSKYKEDQLQINVADYLRLQYPKVLFHHPANERNTSPQRGAKFKRMGVRKGMPDLLIFKQKFVYNQEIDDEFDYSGLAIELKIKPNKTTKEQNKVLNELFKENWKTAICYSFDEAREVIDKYLKDD